MSAPTVSALTEKQWQQQVINLAKTLGWKVYHPWLSIRSERGFPDLTVVKDGRMLMFLELKSERGKVSPQQQEWIDALNATGHAMAMVARPSDWDAVVEVLR